MNEEIQSVLSIFKFYCKIIMHLLFDIELKVSNWSDLNVVLGIRRCCEGVGVQ